MLKITLDEAVRLIEKKKSRLSELRTLRQNSAVMSYEEGEDEAFIEQPERQVEEITSEIKFVQRQIRKLQLSITHANVTVMTGVELDGEELTLGELLIAIKQLREELPFLKKLMNNKNTKQKKKNREYVDGQIVNVTTVHINKVLYNLQVVREDVATYEKLVDKMQATINKLDVDTTIDFVDEEYVAEKSAE